MTPCVANIHDNHYIWTYFILYRQSDRLIFRNSLPLSLEKNEYVSQQTIEMCQRA